MTTPLILERFDLDTGTLITQLGKCELPFQKSNVYVVATEEKLVDENVRRSQFRSITNDQELFNECEKLLEQHFGDDETYSYSLVRNDAMHIKYEKGDYFRAHSDYLSLTSNMIEEFTLIICVIPTETAQPCCNGGETKVSLNNDSFVVSKATTTPGGALLFRKDLLHEGMELTSGFKEILMLNIWGLRKASEQQLVITFDSSSANNDAAVPLDKKSRMAVERASLQLTYVIPVNGLLQFFPGCFFTAYIQFETQKQPKSCNIFHYKCTVCTFEEFRIIYFELTRQSLAAK
jgi:hypothetical protein